MESSSAWLAVLITVVAVLCSVLPAVADENDNGEQAAREFADAFMADPESTRDQLTETMNAALTKQAAAQISTGLEMALGKFQGSRVARWVDTVEGNRRYRIPLEFERGIRDMMLVRDGENRVAGVFFIEHEVVEGAPPAKKVQRPQDPQPPYPYRSVEVTYANGNVQLAGTLTIPAGEGPFPAVILLSGSGAQNRDSEIFGHRPFAVWADVLSRAGIAVLRSDDRGVGDSGGNPAISTTSDFADDAAVAVRYLASRAEIDAKRIGLMGHSEGGVIAPLAAQREKSVAFVVLLAAPAVPGEELLPVQSGRLVRLLGANDEEVDAVESAYQKVAALIKKGERGEALTDAIHKLKIAQGDSSAPTPQEIEMFISPWMTYFLFYDPRPALAELTIPVLAISGDLDFQVDADQNLSSIKHNVKRSNLLTVQRFQTLNHLMQTAKTGSIEEYGAIDETIAPEVLDTVRDWILSL